MQINVKKSVGRLSINLLLGLAAFLGASTGLPLASAAGFGSSTVTEGFLSSEEENEGSTDSKSSEKVTEQKPAQQEQTELKSAPPENSDTDRKSNTPENPESSLPTAVVWYLEMAKNGDPGAQYNLGSVYETGFGVKVDKKEAARWYEKAAEHDHQMAQLKLGIMYVLGDGIRQSMIKGTRWIRTSADNGNALARDIYDKLLSPDVVLEVPASEVIKKLRPYIDQGPKKSTEKLVALLKKQEKKKEKPELKERFTEAPKNTLGKKIDIANKVPEFLEKKLSPDKNLESDNVAFLQREANAGNAEAQFELGKLYETGEKLGRDTSKAMAWFTKAASQGHAESQYRLAKALIFGIGVKRNTISGEDWLTKAAKQNHPVANKMLPMYLANKASAGGVSIALSWYLEKAMDLHGEADGEFGLGHMYENGWGVMPNFNEARKWYAAARTDGSGGAAKRLRQIKAARAAGDPDPERESAPQISEITKEQFASTLKVAGSDEESALNSANAASADRSTRSTISGSLPTRSKNQPTSFNAPKTTSAETTSSPVITTATVTRRSPLTPIILIVFGVILGITVFKWMRRGSYKKAQYRNGKMRNQNFQNRAQYNKSFR